jgi:TPR repeat protein
MNLAISYFEGEGIEQDKEKAVALLIEASEYMADAQYLLAQCYENGEGTALDLAKAKELYQQAADNGIVEAKEWLENQAAE